MSDTTCKNCGGDEGLHHYKTGQCPVGGREAPVGRKQEWKTTTFEPVSDEVTQLRSERDAARAEVARLNAQLIILDGEDGDGLAAINRLYAACERGDIDQHCAPDIQAARAELVALRQHVKELEQAAQLYIESWPKRDDNYYRPDHEDAMDALRDIVSAPLVEQPATLTPSNCEACQRGWRKAIKSAADKAGGIWHLKTVEGYDCDHVVTDIISEIIRAIPMPSFGEDACAGCEPLKPNDKLTDDQKSFGVDAWVYCNQHRKPHQTGWCTVSNRDKIGLGIVGGTRDDAQAAMDKCRDWNLTIYGEGE